MKSLANSQDCEEILQRLDRLRPDSTRDWGRMSVEQMLCHLTDSYLAGLGEKKASPATGFLQRTVFKYFALSAPLRWPKGVPTRPEMEQGKGGTPPEGFERDRAKLKDVTRRFAEPGPDFRWPQHPIFGPLTKPEWLRWGYLHADHHLRQFGA